MNGLGRFMQTFEFWKKSDSERAKQTKYKSQIRISNDLTTMSQRIGRSAASVARVWHHVDAAQETRTLGRLATAIATTLTGKHKPVYDPTFDQGDYVVVTNCAKLRLSGNKFEDKMYWRHSTKPGHLKLTPLKKLVADKGYGEILKKAVSGMLPKNSYRKIRLDRLKVFDGTENPYKENIAAFHDEQSQVLQKIRELEQK